MSVAEEREFWDMCPHRINVARVIRKNNEGRPQVEDGTMRTYRCLIDKSASIARGLQGESDTVGINVHVLPTPVGREDEDVQVEITTDDSVLFMNPEMDKRPLKSVETFYDETGNLHNMVLHFT